MLNYSRKLPAFIQRACKFSTILNPKIVTPNLKTSVEETADEGAALKQLHHDYFIAPENSNLYAVRSGSYMQVPDNIISTTVPEGLGGEITDEFKFSHKKQWMIRDATKIICHILDNFQSDTKSSTSLSNDILPFSPTQFSGKPEWESAKLQISLNGRDVLKGTAQSNDGNVPESYFKALKDTSVPNKIMLTGARGVGKSTILNQAVVYARNNGWLCLFIPNGWDHVQSGPYIDPIPAKENVYDNPVMTTEALRGFWMAHKEQLRQLPIQNIDALKKYSTVIANFKESWHRALSLQGRSELGFIEMRAIIKGDDHYKENDSKDFALLKKFDFLNFAPKTLEDYVLLGVALPEVAGLVFGDLVTELRNIDSFRVLFAVDQYNSWCVNSAFSYDYRSVMGNQIAVPHALNFFGNSRGEAESWHIRNGMCIAATSFKHTEGSKVTFENKKHVIPFRIRVPAYNQTEYLSAISYYMNVGAVDSAITSQDYLEYRIFCGSNPRLIRTESTPFFFPRNVWSKRHEFRQEMLNSLSNGSAVDDESANDENEDDEFDGTDFDEEDEDEVEQNNDINSENKKNARKLSKK